MTTQTISYNPKYERVSYTPTAFIATDRLHAMSRDEGLPTKMKGAVLFADIVGFTKLLGEMEKQFGRKRGADLMTQEINHLFTALIGAVQSYGGVVVGFGGDAITCWFDADDGLRAVASGLAMQREMEAFHEIKLLTLEPISFALKVTIATGTAKRIVVGNPHIQLLDILAGSVLDTLSGLQSSAFAGSVLLDGNSAQQLAVDLVIERWIDLSAQKIALIQATNREIAIQAVDRLLPMLNEEIIKPWLLQPVYERVQSGLGQFTSELRSVVILFLKFSGLQYERDNDVAMKLDSFVCAMQQILTEQGGYLIKLTVDDKGSYLLGTFGAPLSTDDDIINRALNTALVLRSRSQEFDSIESIQIGISQAQVLAGVFGAPQRAAFDLLGNEVNLANRVMNRAKPGQILVTAQIMTQAKHKHQFGGAEEVQLRGVAEAVPLYELLLPQPYQPLIFRRTLIGREHERQQIKRLWEKVQHQQGQILVIEGSPGIGKSHLVADFLEELRQQAPHIIHANCESTSQNTPYYPWRSILPHLLRMTNDEGSASWFYDALPGYPSVFETISMGSDYRKAQDTIFEGFHTLIKKATRSAPLLLVVDDVHWIDEVSLKLIVALSWRITRLPIFLILLHRPIPPDTNLPLSELRVVATYHAMTLDELSSNELETLLAKRLSTKVSALILSLFATITQGNPFFTDELLLTLQSLGFLQIDVEQNVCTLAVVLFQRLLSANCLTRNPESGEWIITPNGSLAAVDLGLPSTVEQVILARIDQLPEAARLTLKVASVIGRTFTQPLLVQANPSLVDTATLDQHLQTLVEHNLILPDQTKVANAYTFRHQLTQEITYKTLMEADRRHLHRSVGDALEVLDPQAIEVLAEHYWQGEARGKAIVYSEQAAQRAQQSAANQAALNYYNRALSLEQRPSWLRRKVEVLHALSLREEEKQLLDLLTGNAEANDAELHLRWGEYFEAIGNYPNAIESIQQAQQLWIKEGDQEGEILSLISLGLIARRKGDYEDARKWQEQSLHLLSMQENNSHLGSSTSLMIKVYNELGAIYRQKGQYPLAIDAGENARRLSQEIGDRSGEVMALNTLGGVAYYQRDFDIASNNYIQALKIRRMIGDLAGEGFTLYNLGVIEHENGNFSEAEAHYLEALSLQQSTQNHWEESNLQSALGVLAYQLGDFVNAEKRLRSGIEISRKIGDKAGEAACLCNLGQILRDQGRLDEAEQLLKQGLRIAKKIADKFLVAMSQSHLALVCLYLHNFEEAIRLARCSIRTRRAINVDELTTIDHSTLALAFWKSGKQRQSLIQVKKTINLLTVCNNHGPEFPERDYFICAQLLYKQDKYTQDKYTNAKAALQKAHQFLIERADKIHDPQKRASFLENVPWHSQIIQACQMGLEQTTFI